MRPSDDQIRGTVERARKATAAPKAPKRKGTLADLDTEGFWARRDSLIAQTGSTEEACRLLERIIKGNELNQLNYLSLGLHAARSVARIVVRREDRIIGYGTGFLAAPGVLITNEHVLRKPATIGTCTAELQYELDARGDEVPCVAFALLDAPTPIIDVRHDLAVVAVAEAAEDGTPLERFGWLNLDPTPGKSPEGEWLTIIQHPGGQRKQLCVRENRLLEYDRDKLHVRYTSDTVAGSSGSPVFNNSWDVVALHHSGVPKTRMVGGVQHWVKADGTTVRPGRDGTLPDDVELQWESNEGIRISAIHDFLKKKRQDDLARRVVRAPTPPPPPSGAWPGAGGSPNERVVVAGGDGAGPVVVPIELVISLPTPADPAAPVAVAANGRGAGEAEALKVSDFADRKGYDPTFLGAGFTVPMPTATGATKQAVLTLADGGTELRYGTYSVVMHRERRLALFSAANRDRRTQGGAEREGIRWRLDPRLAAKATDNRSLQLGASFYEDNPFDKGHLTRFADTNWGTKKVRNGEDSFHFPNCAPQHEDFNQNEAGEGLWFRVEDWVVNTFDVDRLCIFNGPVFDAPKSKRAEDDWKLNPRGRRSADPTFDGVSIPRQFFKVAAYVLDGKLAAQAFIVTQEDLLQDVDGLEEALEDRELRLYRVPVSTIARLTGLDFGPIGKRTTRVNRDELAGANGAGGDDAIERVLSLDSLVP